jgi:hypothetical protein
MKGVALQKEAKRDKSLTYEISPQLLSIDILAQLYAF